MTGKQFDKLNLTHLFCKTWYHVKLLRAVIIIHVHSIFLYDKILLMVVKALHILKLILRTFNKLVKSVLVVYSNHVCGSKEEESMLRFEMKENEGITYKP